MRKLAITNKMRTKRNIFDLQPIGCQIQPCMGVYGKRNFSRSLAGSGTIFAQFVRFVSGVQTNWMKNRHDF